MYRCHHNQAPRYLTDYCTPVSDTVFRQRLRSASSHQVFIPRYRLSTYGRRAFSVTSLTVWNSVPEGMRYLECSVDIYRQSRKTSMFCALEDFTRMRYISLLLTAVTKLLVLLEWWICWNTTCVIRMVDNQATCPSASEISPLQLLSRMHSHLTFAHRTTVASSSNQSWRPACFDKPTLLDPSENKSFFVEECNSVTVAVTVRGCLGVWMWIPIGGFIRRL